jgi:hypothetical protein
MYHRRQTFLHLHYPEKILRRKFIFSFYQLEMIT